MLENLWGALKESGLSFQEWEPWEQELMRAAVTREQRSHLLETSFRHLFSQVCMWDRICPCMSACGGALTCVRPWGESLGKGLQSLRKCSLLGGREGFLEEVSFESP